MSGAPDERTLATGALAEAAGALADAEGLVDAGALAEADASVEFGAADQAGASVEFGAVGQADASVEVGAETLSIASLSEGTSVFSGCGCSDEGGLFIGASEDAGADASVDADKRTGFLADEKPSIRQSVKERRQAWLAETTPEERAACIASIWSQVESSEAFRSARTILLYASLPDEVPTDTILQRWSKPLVPDFDSSVMPDPIGHPCAVASAPGSSDSASPVMPDPIGHPCTVASASSPSDSAFPVMPDPIGHPCAGKTLVLPLVEGERLHLKAYDPAALRPGYQGIPEPLPSCPDVAPETIDLAIIPGRAFTPDGLRLGRGKGFYDRLLPTLTRARKIGVAYPYQILETLPIDPWDVPLDAVYTSSL